MQEIKKLDTIPAQKCFPNKWGGKQLRDELVGEDYATCQN